MCESHKQKGVNNLRSVYVMCVRKRTLSLVYRVCKVVQSGAECKCKWKWNWEKGQGKTPENTCGLNLSIEFRAQLDLS